MPIILMLSFVLDSFSLTMRNTVLYTGGIYISNMNRGNRGSRNWVKASVFVPVGFSGRVIRAIYALLLPVSSCRIILAAMFYR